MSSYQRLLLNVKYVLSAKVIDSSSHAIAFMYGKQISAIVRSVRSAMRVWKKQSSKVSKLYVIYTRTWSSTDRPISCSRTRLPALGLVIILGVLHAFATSDRRMPTLSRVQAMHIHLPQGNTYDSGKDEETFRQSCQIPISLFLSFSPSNSPNSALECLARFLASFISFTSDAAFDPRLLLCHAKRLSKCFVIPEKTCPARKLILHPGARSVMF